MNKTDSLVVELTKDLIDIPSASCKDGENGIASYIKDQLKACGIDSRTYEFEKGRADLVATIGGKDRLMLNGHMDTVPVGEESLWKHGPKAELLGGRLYGRGASDMKGGIACILAAVSDLDLTNARRGILLTFVADEEVELKGSMWLLEKRKSIFNGVKYGIIAEPTNMKIRVAQKGYVEMRIHFHGKAAHGSKPWLGDSAILKAARFVIALQKLADSFKVKDRVLGRGTLNVGKIEGGTATNVVPDSCTINIDRRIVPGETPERAVGQVKGLLKELGINAAIEVISPNNSFKLDKNSRIIGMLKRASNSETAGATGYTEAELYKTKMNIDCAVFGPGYEEVSHQANECVSVENLKRCTEVFKRVIEEWCFG